MNSTINCSDKLSREHYISKNILEQFDAIEASGFPWQPPDTSKGYGVDALTSKVLCDRHNSALSPLDMAAGHAFQQITDAMTYVKKKSLARRPTFYFVSGDALELWGIKTLLGLFSSKIAGAENRVLAGNFSLDFDTACKALSGQGLNSPLGMYVHSSGTEIAPTIGVSPLVSHDQSLVGGLQVNMWGLHLNFFIDTRGGNPVFFEERKLYRPWVIDLNGPKRTARIILTWASQRRTAVRASIDIEKNS